MNRNRGIGFLLLGMIALLAGACYVLASRDYVITISRQQIQDRVNGAFPIEKTYLGAFQVTLSHPVVRLEAGSDRANFLVDADVSVLSGAWRLRGTGDLSGRVRLVPASGEFFLDEAHAERLDIYGVPAQYAPVVGAAADVAAREYFDHHPFYRLRDASFPIRVPLLGRPIAQMTVKKVVVDDGALKITLGPRH